MERERERRVRDNGIMGVPRGSRVHSSSLAHTHPLVLWGGVNVPPQVALEVGAELDGGREEGQADGKQLPATLEARPGKSRKAGTDKEL